MEGGTEQSGRSDRDRHRRHHDERRRERGRDDKDKDRDKDRDRERHSREKTRRTQSRSPQDKGRDHTRKRRRDESLPHAARHLKLSDRAMFEPLLTHYLLTERDVVFRDLSDSEKESRWKRFIDRWNHHGLDDKWYEPRLFLRVARGLPSTEEEHGGEEEEEEEEEEESDSSDDYGPALPPDALSNQEKTKKAGATLPTMDDLRERRELVDEDAKAARSAGRTADRLERKADLKKERDRLDELVPRAAAGTRERQLEKKRMLNDKMRSFRDKSPGAAEVDDNDLMGGGGGDGKSEINEYKKMLAATQKKKTEWEVRREEEARARQAEMDERREQYRAREAETIEMLRVLARQRFG